jgi:MFS family permease
VLLQAGQLLSSVGTATTAIAYPLLVLAVTQSPVKAGVVSFARIIPYPLFAAVAGVAADRWNRRRLMIGADVVCAAAIASLAATLVLDRVVYWQIVVVAFVEGTGSVFFSAASAGALRSVVPPTQLPAAAATQTGRAATARLVGPPLGGALFGLGRALPFVVDAASYVFSTLSLLAMRTPFQERRERDISSFRAQIAEGFSFLWRHPFLRTTTLLFGVANFIFPGLLLVVVVAGTQQGLSRAGRSASSPRRSAPAS